MMLAAERAGLRSGVPSTPEVRHAMAMAFEQELHKLATTSGEHHLAARRLLDCRPWLLVDTDGMGKLRLDPAHDLTSCSWCERVSDPLPRSTPLVSLAMNGWSRDENGNPICPGCAGLGFNPFKLHTELEG